MKKALSLIAIAILLFIAYLLFNTFGSKSKQMLGIAPAPNQEISDSVLSHLSSAIQLRTVSFSDPSLMDSTQCFPEVLVAPYLVLGATDGRYFRNVSKNVYRFMPVFMKEEDLKRPHGTNERISQKDFKNVVKFYMELVKGGV